MISVIEGQIDVKPVIARTHMTPRHRGRLHIVRTARSLAFPDFTNF